MQQEVGRQVGRGLSSLVQEARRDAEEEADWTKILQPQHREWGKIDLFYDFGIQCFVMFDRFSIN